MTRKIFRSIVLVAGTVLLASLLLILGYLYDFFGGVQETQLKDELTLASAAVESTGGGLPRAALVRPLPPDVDRRRRQRPL